MVELSKKWFVAVLVIAIVLTALAFALAFNIGGLGTAVAGFGGPFAAGLYKLLNGVPEWISRGGWPTLGAGILIFCVIIPFLAGYFFEQKHVIATLRGTNSNAGGGSYQTAPSQNIIPIDNLQSAPSSKEEK